MVVKVLSKNLDFIDLESISVIDTFPSVENNCAYHPFRDYQNVKNEK